MSRIDYLLRRLGLAFIVVFGVMVITFVVSRLMPADPARLFSGPRATPQKLQEIRDSFGLEAPIPVQFFRYRGIHIGTCGEILEYLTRPNARFWMI